MSQIHPERATIPAYFNGLAAELENQRVSLSTIVSHSGLRGDNDHAAFAALIRKYLPLRIGVDTGCVVNHLSDLPATDPCHEDYKMSPQIDILLGDYLHNAPLSTEEAFKVLPIEMVLGAVEVTRYLDASKLREDLAKLQRVRRLAEQKSYYTYQDESAIWLRPFAACVGLSSRISEDEIVRQVTEIDDDLRPNVIFLLDKALYLREPYSVRLMKIEENRLFHFISFLKTSIQQFPLGSAYLRSYLPATGWMIFGEPGSLSSGSGSDGDFRRIEEGSSGA